MVWLIFGVLSLVILVLGVGVALKGRKRESLPIHWCGDWLNVPMNLGRKG